MSAFEIAASTSLLTADLSADPRFNFVDRGQLQQVLDEEALGASGIISQDSAAKIGQLTGAKVLVTGRVLLLRRTVPTGEGPAALRS